MTHQHGTHWGEHVALSLVIPVFNEAATIDLFMARITDVFKDEALVGLEMVFVNDGSTDTTLELLLERQKTDPRVQIGRAHV